MSQQEPSGLNSVINNHNWTDDASHSEVKSPFGRDENYWPLFEIPGIIAMMCRPKNKPEAFALHLQFTSYNLWGFYLFIYLFWSELNSIYPIMGSVWYKSAV